MIWTGRFFEPAISSETVLEKPMSKSPLITAGVIAAPPAANCGSSLIFCSSKKPFLRPRKTGATSAIGIRPIFSVTGLAASPLPPPLSSLSPPQPVASRPIAATSATQCSTLRICPPLSSLCAQSIRLPDDTRIP